MEGGKKYILFLRSAHTVPGKALVSIRCLFSRIKAANYRRWVVNKAPQVETTDQVGVIHNIACDYSSSFFTQLAIQLTPAFSQEARHLLA